jgi:hypothetical protein
MKDPYAVAALLETKNLLTNARFHPTQQFGRGGAEYENFFLHSICYAAVA